LRTPAALNRCKRDTKSQKLSEKGLRSTKNYIEIGRV